MRRLGQVVAVLAVLVVSAGLTHASGTPGQKCAASKIKATSKKLSAKLKCISKAVSKGEAVDATCLTTAETKFNTAVGKAEGKGGCTVPGDGLTLEALVDMGTNAITGFADPNTPVCCQDGTGGCANVATVDECTFDIGAPGTVCNGDGTCVAAPATPGVCCSNPTGLPGFSLAPTAKCAAGQEFDPNFFPTGCSDAGGLLDVNGLCPPNGGTCVHFSF